MAEFLKDAVCKFMEEAGEKNLSSVRTPYLPEQFTPKSEEPEGVFSKTCSSHLMKLLFAARLARPDLTVAITRLASKVTAWNRSHDRALRRLFQYVNSTTDYELHGSLSSQDFDTVSLVMSPDADLANDLETSKSTSGLWLELLSSDGLRSWPLGWKSKRQGSTASSTCESEVISAATALKGEALPMLDLLERFWAEPSTYGAWRITHSVSRQQRRATPRLWGTSQGLRGSAWGCCMRSLSSRVLVQRTSSTRRLQATKVTCSPRGWIPPRSRRLLRGSISVRLRGLPTPRLDSLVSCRAPRLQAESERIPASSRRVIKWLLMHRPAVVQLGNSTSVARRPKKSKLEKGRYSIMSWTDARHPCFSAWVVPRPTTIPKQHTCVYTIRLYVRCRTGEQRASKSTLHTRTRVAYVARR